MIPRKTTPTNTFSSSKCQKVKVSSPTLSPTTSHSIEWTHSIRWREVGVLDIMDQYVGLKESVHEEETKKVFIEPEEQVHEEEIEKAIDKPDIQESEKRVEETHASEEPSNREEVEFPLESFDDAFEEVQIQDIFSFSNTGNRSIALKILEQTRYEAGEEIVANFTPRELPASLKSKLVDLRSYARMRGTLYYKVLGVIHVKGEEALI